MLKFVVLFSAALAVATSASVRVNPDELESIWENIQQNILVRQEAAHQEVRNVLEPLRILVATANDKVNSDFEDAKAKVLEDIAKIEQEPHNGEISSCIEEAKLELGRIDSTLIIEYRLAISKIERKAEVEIENAFLIISKITDEIDESQSRIDSCADVQCASDISVELFILYERVIDNLNTAVETANKAVLVTLGRELDEAQLGYERYPNETRQLMQDLRACADERV